MLINCPRCGFQQPEDKYCAQCGVDMETFKPNSPSLLKKIFSSLAIQISLLVIFAGGVGFFLYQQGQNFETKVSRTKSQLQINRSSDAGGSSLATSSESIIENNSNTSLEDSASPREPASAEAAVALTNNSATSTETSISADAKNKDLKTPAVAHSQQLTVYYAEVLRKNFVNILNTSRNTGQFINVGDYSAGILPNIEKAISDAQLRVLTKEVRELSKTKTLQWFYGIRDRQDPHSEIGLATFFEINEVEGHNLRGSLEIQRTWKEPNTGGEFEIQRKSFPAMFEIGGDTGFFMAGVMPPQSNLENDDELTAIDVYKILHSPRFRNGESEFVILIKFEKGN